MKIKTTLIGGRNQKEIFDPENDIYREILKW